MTRSVSIGQMLAVLRIQWLSMKNSLRRRSKRVGLIFSVLAAVVWYGLWSAGAAGLFVLPFYLQGRQLERALPATLFFVLLYWQFSPLLTASMGVSIDLRKMALFPISVGSLFVVECLLRLMNGVEMLLLLAGLTLGMAIRFSREIPVFAPAVALFVLFNVLLSAGLRNLLERLLQRRRFREIFLFAVVMASVSPQLILWSGAGHRVGHRLYAVFQFLPQSFLPSTALAHAYLGSSGAADWTVMAGACAFAAAFGFFQFRRSFRFDFAAARAESLGSQPEGETWADRLYGLPARLLPDPAAGLIEKELRYLSRSARFRFLFLMGCSFGVVAWLPFAMRRGGSGGALHFSFLTLLSLYALLLLGQITFLNCFGLDRSAARYFFWMPVSPTTVLVAKNLAAGGFVALQVLILSLIVLLLRMSFSPWQVLEALVVTGIAALYLASAGNFTSVLFGSGLNPERVSRGGAGRGLQGLIVFLYPILISPILAAYFARYYWRSMQGFVLLLAIAAAGGLALYAASLRLSARLVFLRRERLLEELSRGEGPLVSE